MMTNLYWIIGYEKDFDYIIIGKNTGPYSLFGLPGFEPGGRFYHIVNFIGQVEGRELISLEGPALKKCNLLDRLNKNVKDPERVFFSTEEVSDYLKEISIGELENRLIKANSKEILECFCVEGLLPN